MDAITLLKEDHKAVKKLFREFQKLGDRAMTGKSDLAEKIVRELSVHAAIEENVFYPAVKQGSEELRSDVLESLEEHHVVKWLCSEIDGMHPSDERFDAKMTVLIENVEHHIEEEEGEFFPAVREVFGRKVLTELAEVMAQAKKIAPTKPHPRSPDEPPLSGVASAVMAIVDRARDTARS